MSCHFERRREDGTCEVPDRRRAAGAAALALLLALPSACAGPGRGALVDRHRTELESELSIQLQLRSVPSVLGELPGLGHGQFILDTGAQHTILDRDDAHRLGLPLLRYAHPIRVTRGGVAAGEITEFTEVERLDLGAVAVLAFDPPVVDLTHVQRRLTGLVGQDVLRSWLVVFDGGEAEVRFLPPERADALRAELEAAGADVVRYPLTFWNGVPTIELDCGGGVHATMVVDTGASMTSLPGAAIEALGLRRRGTTRRAHIGGTERSAVYRCRSLRLGGWRVPTWVDEHPGAVGLLGYDVLRRFTIVLDGPGAELWVVSESGRPSR